MKYVAKFILTCFMFISLHVRAGTWLCNIDPYLFRPKESYPYFSPIDIKLMYLGHTVYYNYIPFKLYIRPSYDITTMQSLNDIDVSILTYNSIIKYMDDRKGIHIAIDDNDMIYKMLKSTPSIGYVEKLTGFERYSGFYKCLKK